MASWDERFKDWYAKLDGFTNAADKDKGPQDLAGWAAGVNRDMLEPIEALFKERFGDASPVRIQMLDLKARKKDDHVKRLKADRYALYTFMRKEYLEGVGDLGG